MEQRLIYLIRHGAIKAGNNKRFIGQIDLPLSEEGISQAKRLQQELSCVRLNHIFCSNLQRSLHTANIIAEKHSIKPEITTQIREINLGNWEGKTFDEIIRKYPDEFKQRGKDIANFRPPGGESFADCSKRVMAEFERIVQNTTGHILITGHAGINRTIICHIMGIPLEKIFSFSQDYGGLNLIIYGTFGYRIKKLNQTFRVIPV